MTFPAFRISTKTILDAIVHYDAGLADVAHRGDDAAAPGFAIGSEKPVIQYRAVQARANAMTIDRSSAPSAD